MMVPMLCQTIKLLWPINLSFPRYKRMLRILTKRSKLTSKMRVKLEMITKYAPPIASLVITISSKISMAHLSMAMDQKIQEVRP